MPTRPYPVTVNGVVVARPMVNPEARDFNVTLKKTDNHVDFWITSDGRTKHIRSRLDVGQDDTESNAFSELDLNPFRALGNVVRDIFG